MIIIFGVIFININADTSQSDGSESGILAKDYLFYLAFYFLIFAIIFLIRIIIKIYLICKWSNQLIDPTLIESKIDFYSFFTIGLAEIILSIYGIHEW